MTDTGRGVEVDLSAVTFMDSAGLRALIIARTVPESGRVVLIATSPPVARLLRVTGLADMFVQA